MIAWTDTLLLLKDRISRIIHTLAPNVRTVIAATDPTIRKRAGDSEIETVIATTLPQLRSLGILPLQMTVNIQEPSLPKALARAQGKTGRRNQTVSAIHSHLVHARTRIIAAFYTNR